MLYIVKDPEAVKGLLQDSKVLEIEADGLPSNFVATQVTPRQNKYCDKVSGKPLPF